VWKKRSLYKHRGQNRIRTKKIITVAQKPGEDGGSEQIVKERVFLEFKDNVFWYCQSKVELTTSVLSA
jgi:hypothetical protein